MKKILHIQVLPKLSGAQKISLEIFKTLPNDQFEKWILFSDSTEAGDQQACIDAFEATGAKVILSSKLKRAIGISDFAATKEIYTLCKKEKFNIVHTHSTKPGIVGRIAATMARVPMVIHTVHGLAFHKFIKFPKWQFYWACEMVASLFCDKIIMVNKFYGKYFVWFKRKTSTIYNGIDFSQLINIEKQENKYPRVLFVGRLDEQKDPLTLLRAAKIVVAKHPETILTLVGDGELYGKCTDFIYENNLGDNIKLEGWQNQVSKYYASHDIFAAPSIYESFGLMFVEAGFYNLPIVASNVEGIPEVVADNQTGFLCNAKDVATLASNIIKLIEDKQLRDRMGQTAKNRVKKLFSNKQMTKKYIDIYKSTDNVKNKQ